MGYNAGFLAVFRMKWDLPITNGKIKFGEYLTTTQSRTQSLRQFGQGREALDNAVKKSE